MLGKANSDAEIQYGQRIDCISLVALKVSHKKELCHGSYVQSWRRALILNETHLCSPPAWKYVTAFVLAFTYSVVPLVKAPMDEYPHSIWTIYSLHPKLMSINNTRRHVFFILWKDTVCPAPPPVMSQSHHEKVASGNSKVLLFKWAWLSSGAAARDSIPLGVFHLLFAQIPRAPP